jgi:hypothetical protein
MMNQQMRKLLTLHFSKVSLHLMRAWQLACGIEGLLWFQLEMLLIINKHSKLHCKGFLCFMTKPD